MSEPRNTTDLDTDENGCHTIGNGDCVSAGPCLHTTTGLDANPDDHDDGDDFEDQGGEGEELEFDDEPDDTGEALDPSDMLGEDCPDDLMLEE